MKKATSKRLRLRFVCLILAFALFLLLLASYWVFAKEYSMNGALLLFFLRGLPYFCTFALIFIILDHIVKNEAISLGASIAISSILVCAWSFWSRLKKAEVYRLSLRAEGADVYVDGRITEFGVKWVISEELIIIFFELIAVVIACSMVKRGTH